MPCFFPLLFNSMDHYPRPVAVYGNQQASQSCCCFFCVHLCALEVQNTAGRVQNTEGRIVRPDVGFETSPGSLPRLFFWSSVIKTRPTPETDIFGVQVQPNQASPGRSLNTEGVVGWLTRQTANVPAPSLPLLTNHSPTIIGFGLIRQLTGRLRVETSTCE